MNTVSLLYCCTIPVNSLFLFPDTIQHVRKFCNGCPASAWHNAIGSPADMSNVISLISAWGLKPVMSHFGQDSVYRHCASSFVSLQSDTRRSVLPRQSTTTHCQAEPLSRHTSWVAALAAAAPTTGFEPATLTPALSEFIISIPHAQTPNGAIPDRMKDHCEVEPDDGYDGRGR